jgi:phospholipid/cholesterol/gamma-HCH transport system substrate-binding protein
MMKRSFIVGLFVLAALGLFTVGLFLIGNRHEAFSRHTDFYAEFSDLSGLAKGAKVQVGGMDAGQVVDIAIPGSPSSKFRVRMRLNDRFNGLVRTDSLASIGTEGVVGDTFLFIRPGSPQASAAPALSTLRSKEPTEIADLLDQVKGTITDVDGTVKDADGLLTTVGGNLNSTLHGVQTTVANVNDVVLGLKQGRGPAGMLLHDEALAGQIRATITSTQQATGNLNHVSVQADSLLADVQARQFPKKIDDTLAVVKETASNLDATTQQVRQTVADFTAPDEQGVTAGVNLRETLSNVDSATANMADDTEALKHNFFFRPFFRHRGYYNLAELSPDKYRQDRLFASPANHRDWLPADQVFLRDGNGVEQLTAKGKTLIDSAVVQSGDSVAQSPIVVEGYSNSGNAADQLSDARRRSLVVRSYVLNHFQLDPGHMGAVALADRPPSGLDHSEWNGVAIVVVKPKK